MSLFKLNYNKKISNLNFSFSINEIFVDFSKKEAKFGLISDIHSQTEKMKQILKLFEKNSIDFIVIAGDIYDSPIFRGYFTESSGYKQMLNVLKILSDQKLPVFVIPGNHENKFVYKKAMKKFQEKNIIDMVEYRSIDLNWIQVISLPGYQFENFVVPNGYFSDKSFVMQTSVFVKNKISLLVSHGPPKINGIITPAITHSGRDVGDANITKMAKRSGIKFIVCGHVHEASGIAVDFLGKQIAENEWVEELVLNIGTLESWENIDGNLYDKTASIFTIKKNGKAKYEIIH